MSFLFFGIEKASAATYYVKNGGNDSLDGMSDATAWAHCPGMDGWMDTKTLQSGDVVHFRSQDAWTSASTTVSLIKLVAGVTYDGGSTYGTGERAKFKTDFGYKGQSGQSNNFGIVNISDSNIIFKNFEVDGNQVNTTGISIGYGGSAITNITIENCKVHDNGNPSTTGQWMYGILISSRTDGVFNTNITVKDSEIYNTYAEGIAIYPSWNSKNNGVRDILIKGCKVHHTGTKSGSNGDVGVSIVNNADNVTVEDCALYSNYYGVNFRNSPDPGFANGTPNNMVIRYNKIYDNRLGINGFDAYGQLETGDFYGNLIYNNTSFDFLIHRYNWDSSVFNIYNNTFYNTVSASASVSIGPYSNLILGTPKFNFINNIVYTTNCIAIDDQRNMLTHMNNLVYRPTGVTTRNLVSHNVSLPLTSITVASSSYPNPDVYYFDKMGGTAWNTLISPGEYVVWSGFSESTLNNVPMFVAAVTADRITFNREDSYINYSETSTVTGEILVTKTYTNAQINEGSWGSNEIAVDPKFIANGNDFALQVGSPAIDKGTNSGFFRDFAGNPIQGIPDIGAYEYQSEEVVPQNYSITKFITLISNWLKTGTVSDLNSDNIVNTKDLGIMMSKWN